MKVMKSEPQLVLTMSATEARWLKEAMQNPMPGEDLHCAQKREQLFDCLQAKLHNTTCD